MMRSAIISRGLEVYSNDYCCIPFRSEIMTFINNTKGIISGGIGGSMSKERSSFVEPSG